MVAYAVIFQSCETKTQQQAEDSESCADLHASLVGLNREGRAKGGELTAFKLKFLAWIKLFIFIPCAYAKKVAFISDFWWSAV